MTDQPAVLRLATELELVHTQFPDGLKTYAARLLREQQAEIERLRADAARIDWLERNGIGCDKIGGLGFFVYRNGNCHSGDTARAALDAAMAEERKP